MTRTRIALLSHCNFLGSSAMHVFSLAEHLVLRSYDVVVAVPDGPETVRRHRPPTFPIVTFEQALESGFPFVSGPKADLLHVWTPREKMRRYVEALAARWGATRYLIHLEDNEEELVAAGLNGLAYETFAALPTHHVDLVIRNHQFHPIRGAAFMRESAGITCLIEELRDLVPPGVASTVFWPGFDPEYETLPDVRGEIRTELGISPDEIVLVYGGNTHAANVGEVRSLYQAVLALRQRGHAVRLVRTGVDHTPLALPQDTEASIELGFVDRARLPVILAAADILVQPGRSDRFNDYRFPSKLPEYLVSGRPVILPDSNIGRRLDDGRQALKLHTGQVVEIVERTEQLIVDPALRAALGRESRSFALAHLRWSGAADILAATYDKALAVSPDRRTTAAPTDNAPRQAVTLTAFYEPAIAAPDGEASADRMRADAAAAQRLGISAFCLRSSAEPHAATRTWLTCGAAMPFCLLHEVAQESAGDLIGRIAPFLADTRALHLRDEVLLILDPGALRRAHLTPDLIRQAAVARDDVGTLHLAAVASREQRDLLAEGFDSLLELRPEAVGGRHYPERDYLETACASTAGLPPGLPLFRTCLAGAGVRMATHGEGPEYRNASPKAFGHWLRSLARDALATRHLPPLVFLDAWQDELRYEESRMSAGRDGYLLDLVDEALRHGLADVIERGSNPNRERMFTAAVTLT